MKTVSVLIGNSDDGLTQALWSAFFNRIENAIHKYATEVHFTGGSASWSVYQNACFVFVCPDHRTGYLKAEISVEAKRFNQSSIAWVEGTTEFI
jgi:hypothetical protein